MKLGQSVRVVAVPPGLPSRNEDDAEMRRIFERCVGRTFSVIGLEHGRLELHVGEVVGLKPFMHSIWIEPQFVEPVA